MLNKSLTTILYIKHSSEFRYSIQMKFSRQGNTEEWRRQRDHTLTQSNKYDVQTERWRSTCNSGTIVVIGVLHVSDSWIVSASGIVNVIYVCYDMVWVTYIRSLCMIRLSKALGQIQISIPNSTQTKPIYMLQNTSEPLFRFIHYSNYCIQIEICTNNIA